MWGKRRGRVGAFLDEGSEIEGRYTCAGTVVLDAKLRGDVVAHDTLLLGERGVVEGTVRAGALVVRGTIVGDVTATDSVELKATARVTGDVASPLVVIEKGAVLDGRCRMTKEEPAAAHGAVVVPIK